ncbi:MAG: YifB family Mg chelatase-like AAA ATPase [Alphaproteobacteria bacterium]|nr:YifB family Mg chelatase-like AAA ATPase [Alphaproteobacteria bacterium]MCL2505294.1 YifB family Mg chelatase-like AAA ATPase [Alphaproteobacteria bacterium]
MLSSSLTVAFEGTSAFTINVQVLVSSGKAVMNIVGLPDKAVGESKERVRAALLSMGVDLPSIHISVNLAPADVIKEGTHFDLPIAVALLGALGVVPQETVSEYLFLGELGLDGKISQVSGVLPAAIHAKSLSKGIICPPNNSAEALWASGISVLAPPSLKALVRHFKGEDILVPPEQSLKLSTMSYPDLSDIKGQETAKRVLEIAAAGGHNLLMTGPPGSGKSMLASRLIGILPPMEPEEALEVSMIHSVSGMLGEGGIVHQRPFRDPHHSASLPALIGGGQKARPGEVSLAHNGVLFLDELPEFQRSALEALRQPIESGKAVVARANNHVTYPARFQLIAAMNPCRCGYMNDAKRSCGKAPKCAIDYQSKISGPIFDRIDCHIEVPAVSAMDLGLPSNAESSKDIAARVIRARKIQKERYAEIAKKHNMSKSQLPRTNALADGKLLEEAVAINDDARAVLVKAVDTLQLSARGYHRILRVARTLADLEGKDTVTGFHVSEVVSYRQIRAS